jgi:hypothetical protein
MHSRESKLQFNIHRTKLHNNILLHFYTQRAHVTRECKRVNQQKLMMPDTRTFEQSCMHRELAN